MSTSEFWTADEFVARRFELPEAGQWSELEEGVVVHLQPPDLDHGTVILNLSKVFSEHAHSTERGYACFDLGLLLQSNPDTVRFPAVCYFDVGPRFSESDQSFTATTPALVVELVSTADRREKQPERSLQYLHWGVSTVWAIDPQERAVDVFQSGEAVRRLTDTDRITSEARLSSFQVQVSTLFAEPSWWTGTF